MSRTCINCGCKVDEVAKSGFIFHNVQCPKCHRTVITEEASGGTEQFLNEHREYRPKESK